MKSVLISIQPKWCALIANGKKTIEVRKTAPKEVPFKCYIYCTKQGRPLVEDWYGKYRFTSGISKKEADELFEILQGKVIGEFVCDSIYTITNNGSFNINNDTALTNQIAKASCLDYVDMKNYLGTNDGYGWHISDLKIYDKLKELSEFKKVGFMTENEWLYNLYPNTHCSYPAWAKKFEITRPPQSWQYVEELTSKDGEE